MSCRSILLYDHDHQITKTHSIGAITTNLQETPSIWAIKVKLQKTHSISTITTNLQETPSIWAIKVKLQKTSSIWTTMVKLSRWKNEQNLWTERI